MPSSETVPPQIRQMMRLARVLPGQAWQDSNRSSLPAHQFLRRMEWRGQQVPFDEAAATIKAYGYPKVYYHLAAQFLNVDGWTYWTVNDHSGQPCLLHRARVMYQHTMYDRLADYYDDWFNDPASQEENQTILTRLTPRGHVLDIGCGTGSLLKAFPAVFAEVQYTGIDISAQMIARARATQPERAEQFHHVAFGDWWTGRYDLIFGLFGSPSYLRPEEIARIPYLLKPGGRSFLMLYDAGYEPFTHQQMRGQPGVARPAFYRSTVGELVFGKYRLIEQQRGP